MAKVKNYLNSSDFRVTYDVPLAEKISPDIGYESPTSNRFYLPSLNAEGKDSYRRNAVHKNSESSTEDDDSNSSESSSPSDPISLSPKCSALNFWNEADDYRNDISSDCSSDKKLTTLDSEMTFPDILSSKEVSVNSSQSENSLRNHCPPDFTFQNSQTRSWKSDSDHSDSGVDLCDLLFVDGCGGQSQLPTNHNNSTFVDSGSDKSIITSVDNENSISDMLSSVCLNINDNFPSKSYIDTSTVVQKNHSNISVDSIPSTVSNNVLFSTVKADSGFSDLLSSLCFDDEDNKLSSISISEDSNMLKSIDFSIPVKEDTSESIDLSTVKADSRFSDLLSSICFDDDCHKFSTNVTSEDTNLFKNSDFSILVKEDVNELTASKNLISRQISNLQQTDDENEISLADLALEHLSSSQPTNSLHAIFNQVEENANLKMDCHLPVKCETCQSDSAELTNKCSIDNLSMLDLLIDVNPKTDKNSECPKEECNDTVQLVTWSSTENNFVEDVVDLTSCLKSSKTPSATPSNATVVKDRFVDYSASSFPQFSNFAKDENEIVSQARKANTKRSLFAKALSCKPRKNRSVIDKVTCLQEAICNNLFNPSKTIVERFPIKEKCPANHCAVTSLGRRIFGPNIPCEIV